MNRKMKITITPFLVIVLMMTLALPAFATSHTVSIAPGKTTPVPLPSAKSYSVTFSVSSGTGTTGNVVNCYLESTTGNNSWTVRGSLRLTLYLQTGGTLRYTLLPSEINCRIRFSAASSNVGNTAVTYTY